MTSEAAANEKCANHHDDRAMAGFLRNQNWLAHIDGLDPSTLPELYRLASSDDPFQSLPSRIHAFLAKMQTCIQTHALQRKIGRRPGSEHDRQVERHHRSVRYETHQKYANWIAESLCLLLRRICDEKEPYMNFFVPPHIHEKASSLASALHKTRTPNNGNQASSDQLFEDDQNSDDEQEEEDGPEDPDNDLYRLPPDGSDQLEPNQIKPYGPAQYKDPPIYNDPIQSLLIELLFALYTDVPNGLSDDGFRSVFVRYIVLTSVKASGQWRTPSDITPRVAGILFTGRVTFGYKMLQHQSTNPTLTYDQ